jgi:hypothetical protein
MPNKRPFDNWLRAWYKLFEGTEVPLEYQIWAGISTISTTLQDNVWIQKGIRRVIPNMYVWLIGPPGSGKGEACERSLGLLRENPFVNVFSGKLTEAYLLLYMQGITQQQQLQQPSIFNPRLEIYSDELAVTMGSGERNQDLLRALTTMYTGADYDYGTIAHGLVRIQKPVINWLAGTTVPWLRRAIPHDLLNSGFIARVIAAVGKLSKDPKPWIPPVDKILWNDLIVDLARISLLRGEYTFAPDARTYHDAWYAEQHAAMREIDDDVLQGMYGREQDHVYKVAMCITASATDDMIITKHAFENAATLITAAKTTSVSILRNIEMHPEIEKKFYLLEKITRAGEIPVNKLLKNTNRRIHGAKELHALLNSLVYEGSVTTFNNGDGVIVKIVRGD